MNEWKRVEPTTVSKVGYRTITSKTFVMPNGETGTFDTMWPDGQQFAAAIALTPDRQVIVAKMFRFGPEKIMFELPGGFVDGDETPEQTVRHELPEETGYAVGRIAYLGASHKDTYMNATWHYFLATDCELSGEQNLEPEEHIDVQLISIKELIENAKTDLMTDAVAVLMAYDKLVEIQDGE